MGGAVSDAVGGAVSGAVGGAVGGLRCWGAVPYTSDTLRSTLVPSILYAVLEVWRAALGRCVSVGAVVLRCWNAGCSARIRYRGPAEERNAVGGE